LTSGIRIELDMALPGEWHPPGQIGDVVRPPEPLGGGTPDVARLHLVVIAEIRVADD
jgi:hypothetical protein